MVYVRRYTIVSNLLVLARSLIIVALSQTTKFKTLPHLKELADDKFEYDENREKFPERVKNAVQKGEIARYEQFLLFPQSFQKTCTRDT